MNLDRQSEKSVNRERSRTGLKSLSVTICPALLSWRSTKFSGPSCRKNSDSGCRAGLGWVETRTGWKPGATSSPRDWKRKKGSTLCKRLIKYSQRKILPVFGWEKKQKNKINWNMLRPKHRIHITILQNEKVGVYFGYLQMNLGHLCIRTQVEHVQGHRWSIHTS